MVAKCKRRMGSRHTNLHMIKLLHSDHKFLRPCHENNRNIIETIAKIFRKSPYNKKVPLKNLRGANKNIYI